MKKQKVIIDCDTGVDDAVALVYGINEEKLDIKLVTVSYGNVELKRATSNTLHLLEKFGKAIPVAVGSKKPMVKKAVLAKEVHQGKGMGLYEPLRPKTKPVKDDATKAMYKVITSNPGEITIICLGPCTNIGMLIKHHPSVKEKLKEIVLMTGSYNSSGNVKPYAEFNAYNDPEALDIVLKSGIKVTIIPMEIGVNARMHTKEVNKLRKINEVGAFIGKMFDGYIEVFMDIKGTQLHDISAMFYLLNPKLFIANKAEVSVSTENENRGQTFVKFYRNGKATVLIDVNKQELYNEMYDRLAKIEFKKEP